MPFREVTTSILRSLHGRDKGAQTQGVRDLPKVTWVTNGRNKMKILVYLLQEPGFPFSHWTVDLLVGSAGLTELQDRSGLWDDLSDSSMSVCLGAWPPDCLTT